MTTKPRHLHQYRDRIKMQERHRLDREAHLRKFPRLTQITYQLRPQQSHYIITKNDR